jgi:predicted GIY-YIG superfamily endonuclease
MEYTFYRIKSKNISITECYIGSTEDIEVRISRHKSMCNNINDPHYNLKVYKYIRSNGGWDDFEFEIIDKIIFSETYRFIHEQKLMDLYASTLNSRRAIRTEEELKEYRKEYKKQYIETHKEKIKENTKKYRETHKEEIKEKDKQYYEANKEKIKERKKQYYLKKKQEKLTQPSI